MRDFEIFLKFLCCQSDLLPRGLSFACEEEKKDYFKILCFILKQDSLVNLETEKKKYLCIYWKPLSQHFHALYELTAATHVIIKHFYACSALVSIAKGIFSNSGLCPCEQLA